MLLSYADSPIHMIYDIIGLAVNENNVYVAMYQLLGTRIFIPWNINTNHNLSLDSKRRIILNIYIFFGLTGNLSLREQVI